MKSKRCKKIYIKYKYIYLFSNLLFCHWFTNREQPWLLISCYRKFINYTLKMKIENSVTERSGGQGWAGCMVSFRSFSVFATHNVRSHVCYFVVNIK